MRIIGFGATAALVGCAVEHQPRPDDGGQSGTAVPDGCYEDHREAVEDPSVAPEGFDRSADEVLAQVVGDWRGEGTPDGGDPVALSFVVAHDGGPILAIRDVWRGGNDGQGAPTTGEPTCPPRYLFGVVTSLDAGALAAGEGLGDNAGGVVDPVVVSRTARADVIGSAAPSWGEQDWDTTSLVATLVAGTSPTLTLRWVGEDEGRRGAATSSTTAPSSVEEAILTASVTRVVE